MVSDERSIEPDPEDDVLSSSERAENALHDAIRTSGHDLRGSSGGPTPTKQEIEALAHDADRIAALFAFPSASSPHSACSERAIARLVVSLASARSDREAMSKWKDLASENWGAVVRENLKLTSRASAAEFLRLQAALFEFELLDIDDLIVPRFAHVT